MKTPGPLQLKLAKEHDGEVHFSLARTVKAIVINHSYCDVYNYGECCGRDKSLTFHG